MKTEVIKVTVSYNEEGKPARMILLESFRCFLKTAVCMFASEDEVSLQ